MPEDLEMEMVTMLLKRARINQPDLNHAAPEDVGAAMEADPDPEQAREAEADDGEWPEFADGDIAWWDGVMYEYNSRLELWWSWNPRWFWNADGYGDW